MVQCCSIPVGIQNQLVELTFFGPCRSISHRLDSPGENRKLGRKEVKYNSSIFWIHMVSMCFVHMTAHVKIRGLCLLHDVL